MTAGLPGTGVGGLFYMVSGLLMPFRETYRALRGKSDRRSRRLVAYQTVMALGVVAGIWVTGWLLGLIISWAPAVAAAVHGTSHVATHASNVVRAMAFFIGFATLALVLVAVQVARVVNACRVRIRHQPGAPGAWLERDAA
jgi:fucose permease